MLPSPDLLNDYPYGKFVLSNLAAKRAKQLKEGAMPLVQVDSQHPLTIALAEIAAGKIKPILTAQEDKIVMEGVDLALITEEGVPGHLGMLLPALDETEAALVTNLIIEDHDVEAEVEGDEIPVVSLSDLGDVEEEEVAPAVASEDDTLSLSDIADQESADEEETES